MSKATTTYFIGLDIGTSSAKAVAFSHEGQVLAKAARTYEIQHPAPGAAVQDAEEVRQASLDSLLEVVQHQGGPPEAIGLSSAMHSLLAVDANGKALSPLITWADGRARPYTEKLKKTEH